MTFRWEIFFSRITWSQNSNSFGVNLISLTFSGFSDLVSCLLLSSQELLNTSRWARHFYAGYRVGESNQNKETKWLRPFRWRNAGFGMIRITWFDWLRLGQERRMGGVAPAACFAEPVLIVSIVEISSPSAKMQKYLSKLDLKCVKLLQNQRLVQSQAVSHWIDRPELRFDGKIDDSIFATIFQNKQHFPIRSKHDVPCGRDSKHLGKCWQMHQLSDRRQTRSIYQVSKFSIYRFFLVN